uniref:RRM domain-containing protein n=1 Tax=Lepeophtheirus salmonis TaxID=72036 RepID=A0A0K2TIC8_LEPSM
MKMHSLRTMEDPPQSNGTPEYISDSTLNGGLNNNDAKRVKLDSNLSPPSSNINMHNNNNNNSSTPAAAANHHPSRVIHIRNIPADVSEAEIIHLGIPFGRVTNVLVLKGKNQAFLEMEAESSAIAMVNYFTNCVAQLRERSVYVQFSNHKELKTDKTHSNANASAQAAIQAAQALSGPETPGNESLTNGENIPSSNVQTKNNSSGGPNTVLRVVVEQMVYPVTLDVIYQIFTRMGKVLKIVTFTKNNTFQALIQYPDVIMAQAAKMSLDGQNIYNACCKLKIEYSKLSNLNVRYNNDKSRDYTRPSLPTGGSTSMDSPNCTGAANSTAAAIHQLAAATSNPNGASVIGSPFSAMGLAAATNPLAGAAGYASPAGLTSNMATLAAASFPLANTGVASFGQTGLRFAGSPGVAGSGCVLLVSNLDENLTQCDHLFILFGVYGDVQRVKILFNKKDSALVQMSEPQQALLAMNYLDKVKLWNKAIKVMHSKHMTVQLPKDGQPDAGLTKDYTSSNLHRFKKPGSKNYQNIYPPSSTLHLSNIPSSIEEDQLRSAFREIGLNVQAFKFFPNDRKMALVQLASMDEAITALIKLHNYQLSETSHLRVSFSKSTI